MSHTGTMRGTPKPSKHHQPQQFGHSPSAIPRPSGLENHTHVAQSEAGGSSLSASRAKMSKRDDVSSFAASRRLLTDVATGNSTQDRDGLEQEEEPQRASPTFQESPAWHRPCPEAVSGTPNKAVYLGR